jgi:hypothetical protein
MKKQIAITVVLLLSMAAWAQQPAPAPSSGDSSSKADSNSEGPKALEPDKPLYQEGDQTPVDENITPQPTYNSGVIASNPEGGTPFKRPVLTPSFQFVQSVLSQESTVGNGMIWRGQQTVVGALTFQWDIGQSGSLFYNGTGLWQSLDSYAYTVQQLSYLQRFHIGRWMASVTDQASYSPQSTFGFGGLQGLYGSSALGSLAGGSMIPSGLIPGTTPSQSVLTTNADRVSNTTAGELQYSLTARDSLRFGGSYGLIRGIDDNLLDGNQYSATAGFDHRIDASDTLGLTYIYSSFTFPNSQEDSHTQSTGLSWARRLTGRLSMQTYVGAQLTDYTQNGVATNDLSWGTSGYLNYQRTRNSMNLQFYHGVTGGSGVFAGANTTTVQGGLSHVFSPRVSAGMRAGYARNSYIQQSSQYTNTYFVGAQVSRRVGRDANLYFDYTLQRQTLSQTVVVPTAFNGIQHMFSIGISWAHPIRIAQ